MDEKPIFALHATLLSARVWTRIIAGVEPYVSRERSNCCFGSQVCSTIAVSITIVGEVYGVVAKIRRERETERAFDDGLATQLGTRGSQVAPRLTYSTEALG